jgi:hypothetical protein
MTSDLSSRIMIFPRIRDSSVRPSHVSKVREVSPRSWDPATRPWAGTAWVFLGLHGRCCLGERALLPGGRPSSPDIAVPLTPRRSAQVDRLPEGVVGTFHSETGVVVEALVPVGEVRGFEELAMEILPLDRAELRYLRVQRALRDVRKPFERLQAPPQGSNKATLWDSWSHFTRDPLYELPRTPTYYEVRE